MAPLQDFVGLLWTITHNGLPLRKLALTHAMRLGYVMVKCQWGTATMPLFLAEHQEACIQMSIFFPCTQYKSFLMKGLKQGGRNEISMWSLHLICAVLDAAEELCDFLWSSEKPDLAAFLCCKGVPCWNNEVIAFHGKLQGMESYQVSCHQDHPSKVGLLLRRLESPWDQRPLRCVIIMRQREKEELCRSQVDWSLLGWYW